MAQPPFLALPGTPVHDLFPRRNMQALPIGLQQVMSPRRRAEMAAAAAQGNPIPPPGAPPHTAPQTNQRGVYQGDQVP